MIRFRWDSAGVFRAEGDPVLAGFFMDEIQGNPAQLRRYRERVDAAVAGHLPTWTATGNAHRVVLTPGGVTIEGLFGSAPPRLRLSLDTFRDALADCGDFLATGC